MKIPKDKDEREVQRARLECIKQYYINPVKLSLIITLAKPYLKNGDILILTGKGDWEIVRDVKQLIFFDSEYNTRIVFESSKLLKVIDNCNDVGLTDILLKNSEIFCIPGGKKVITDSAGLTRIVYNYDAVGLSTVYLKNDREWKSRTIMTSSSRDDLKEMLKQASDQKNGE